MPDMTKLAQAAKDVQDRQQKMDDRKIEIMARIEQKLDRILDELKKK